MHLVPLIFGCSNYAMTLFQRVREWRVGVCPNRRLLHGHHVPQEPGVPGGQQRLPDHVRGLRGGVRPQLRLHRMRMPERQNHVTGCKNMSHPLKTFVLNN